MKNLPPLTERQRHILGMALRYMKSNLDDVNDTFAHESGNGGISYAGKRMTSVDERDVDAILGALGED